MTADSKYAVPTCVVISVVGEKTEWCERVFKKFDKDRNKGAHVGAPLQKIIGEVGDGGQQVRCPYMRGDKCGRWESQGDMRPCYRDR